MPPIGGAHEIRPVAESDRAEWLRMRGLLYSDCLLDNTVSQAFHTAIGFEEAERQVCYRRDLG